MTTTLTERAQSFGHLFVERVARTPNGEAYRYLVGGEWQSLTWAQTKDRVFRIAAGLIDLGVQPQQRVAIAANTRIEWILADLATLCAGGATTSGEDPMILGVPFNLAWLICWIVLSSVCMWAAYRVEAARDKKDGGA